MKDSLTVEIPSDHIGGFCRFVVETEANRILFISPVHLELLGDDESIRVSCIEILLGSKNSLRDHN